MSRFYYFDSDATHPPFFEILKGTLDCYKSNYFNPSGATKFSLQRQSQISKAREYLANFTLKKSEDFVFHSSSTEAVHFISFNLSKNINSKILVSPFEHSCVYSALDKYNILYEIIPSDKTGILNLDFIFEKIVENSSMTLWISPVASETGILQPISEIIQRYKDTKLISDLTQTICKLKIDFSLFKSFVFSGHKIGAGLGCGVSYLDFESFPNNQSLFAGGFQENENRAGTENTEAIINLRKVLEFQNEKFDLKVKKLISLKKEIEENLIQLGCEIIGKDSPRVCSTIFFLLPFDSENVDFFMIAMEQKNIILSTGSSCKSRTRSPSRSLIAMGYSEAESLRAIRISINYFTTLEEVDYLNCALREVILQLTNS